ncbi:Programmed cell death protein 2, C-terminal putative domain containing protein [Naviculisporaceae sp. PSN 640]
MVNYDSDSSGGEDNDFTETNVLLGYASGDANGEEISRLGGRPDWLDPSKPPSAALARCKICKDLMVLLLQLNAELPDRFPGHERRLYVFSCRRKSCRRREGSIRAIRGVRVSEDVPATGTTTKDKPEAAPVPAPSAKSLGLGEALFGVAKTSTSSGGNPFATGGSTAAAAVNPFAPKSSSSGASNPFAPAPAPAKTTPQPTTKEEEETEKENEAEKKLPMTFAQKLALNNDQDQAVSLGPAPPPEPWPIESEQPAPFPIRWLSDAEYETLDPNPPALPAQATNVSAMDIDGDNSGGGSGKEDKEVFESTMDSVFQKFADRVGQNPEQCIRYEFAGTPLLYSKNDTVGKLLYTGGEGNEKVKVAKGLPRCTNCGSGRVFEVQMTPHAITELEIDEDGMEGMDWGTIILGVCERDCTERGTKKGDAGYVEEWAGVQWEELSVKR